MTTITYAEDQTYESAFMAIQRLIHAGNPGQTITIERHHINRDGKWFTVTVEPYETQAQASHLTPDGEAEGDEESWPAEFYITAVRTHGDGKVTGFEACEERDDAAQLRRNGHGPTRTYVPADTPASPVLPDDDHPILLALREALGEELEQAEDWRNDDGEEFIPNDPTVEALGVAIGEKLKPLLGASPLLGDEERERLTDDDRIRFRTIADGIENEIEEGALHTDWSIELPFLRKLAQGEERDA